MRWAERHQVALYLLGIVAGGGLGLLVPGAALLSSAINPLLALLLFVTFLGIPMLFVMRALRDVRFLLTVVVVNFVTVPLIVWVLSRTVVDDDALLLGVLLVLLTPCVDYVIVFTGLAGGAKDRLLAATPVLMLLQILLLPLYVRLFAGKGVVERIPFAPFVDAFLFLILLPMLAAALVQALTRGRRATRMVTEATGTAMVPLMVAVLFVVAASQIVGLGEQTATLLRLVPLYVTFLAVMLGIGILAARVARLPVPQSRAVIFSGVTRNSLVVLPLALAMPSPLTALAVVTQTLVELVGMVLFVWLVPRLMPERRRSAPLR